MLSLSAQWEINLHFLIEKKEVFLAECRKSAVSKRRHFSEPSKDRKRSNSIFRISSRGKADKMDAKKKESRDAMYQADDAQDAINKLQEELEIKAEMLNDADKEREGVEEKYEGRMDRLRAEIKDLKEDHDKEIGDILEENETMKKELEEERFKSREFRRGRSLIGWNDKVKSVQRVESD